MSVICTICARGGSKGVKNKNILPVYGKPLIAYTLEQAKQSQLFDVIAVSSDSERILEVAAEWGADYLVKRPDELANDTAAKIPAIRHCVEQTENHYGTTYDIVFDLDVTSPLRLVADILDSYKLFQEKRASNLITACPSRKSPYFNLVELDEHGKVHLSKQVQTQVIRRQDSPQCFDMNGSIYIWRRDSLFASPSVFQNDTALFIMPEDRSIDIDTPVDLELVKILLQTKGDKHDTIS